MDLSLVKKVICKQIYYKVGPLNQWDWSRRTDIEWPPKLLQKQNSREQGLPDWVNSLYKKETKVLFFHNNFESLS